MLIKKRSKFAILAILSVVFSPSIVSAQISSSPYSGSGIGEINRPGLIHNAGMGGVGIAHGSVWYINAINPALLTLNTLSGFDVGFNTEIRSLSDGTASQTNVSGNLNYLVFAFPVISGKWSMALGMNPYSSVNYDFRSISLVSGSTTTEVEESYLGKGGLNQYYLSSGFNIYKGFSFGFKASLLTGSVNRDESIALGGYEIVEDEIVRAFYVTGLTQNDYTIDYGLNLGLSYRLPIGEKNGFTFAAIYELKNNLSTERLQRLEHRTYNNEHVLLYPVDTLRNNTIYNNLKGSVVIPAKWGVGLAYHKSTNFSVEADFTTQDWTQYENFEGSSENLQRSWFAALGTEYTPDPVSTKNYLSRITYRGGFNYERSPFYYNGTHINEFGINFGASFPVSRLSNLNLAFKYGRRGTTNNGLLLEEFYRISFGVTFNDKWFNKRKFD